MKLYMQAEVYSRWCCLWKVYVKQRSLHRPLQFLNNPRDCSDVYFKITRRKRAREKRVIILRISSFNCHATIFIYHRRLFYFKTVFSRKFK